MRRNILGRHTWRARSIWLAIGATGFATAFATAGMTTKADPSAMKRTITHQRIAPGETAQPPSRDRDAPLSAGEMLTAADAYELDMTKLVEHAETLRIIAYRAHDIIRMTCVDDKLGQM